MGTWVRQILLTGRRFHKAWGRSREFEDWFTAFYIGAIVCAITLECPNRQPGGGDGFMAPRRACRVLKTTGS
jgi:hypothetical protein